MHATDIITNSIRVTSTEKSIVIALYILEVFSISIPFDHFQLGPWIAYHLLYFIFAYRLLCFILKRNAMVL